MSDDKSNQSKFPDEWTLLNIKEAMSLKRTMGFCRRCGTQYDFYVIPDRWYWPRNCPLCGKPIAEPLAESHP